MELLMLVALLSCLAAVLWQCTRRSAVEVQQPTIEIGDAAVAQRALIENANAFSDRPLALFPVILVTGRRRRRSDNISSAPYGPHWRVLRCNLTSKLLHPSRLSFLAPLQRVAVQDLLAGLSARDEVVVVRDSLHDAVFALVARMCFGDGVAHRDVRAAQRVMQEFVLGVGQAKAYAGSKLAKLLHWRRWRRFLASRGNMAEVFFPIIAAAGRRTCKDGVLPYVDSLLDLRVPDDAGARRALTDDEMVSLVSEFLGAGTETVVACVEWTLAHLVAQPEVQKRLQREVDGEAGKGKGKGVMPMPDELRQRGMPYLHAVILESLRMHPPVPFLMRDVHAEDAAALAGKATVVTPAGLRVHFMLGDIGRDSNTWKDPDDFRPERFLPGGEAEDVGPLPGPKEIRMMPFGAGRRFCPGMGLSILHVKLCLVALVRGFEWAPVAGQNVDLTELDGFFKTMKKPLRACITKRFNATRR
nr:cytochrome P450 89A2-like [Lolium perenne]